MSRQVYFRNILELDRLYSHFGILLIFLFFVQARGFAQSEANFPYSRFGIGALNHQNTVIQNISGNIGVCIPSSRYLNIDNPAALSTLQLTSINFGVQGGKVMLNTTDKQQESPIANLNNISYAFPIGKNWVTAISLFPKSTVKYQSFDSSTVAFDTLFTKYKYVGYGGTSAIVFSNGVNIGKHLSLGINSSFLFGNISHESIGWITDSSNYQIGYKSGILRKTTLRGFDMKFGAMYRLTLGENKALNLGLTYMLQSDLKANRITTYDQRSANDQIVLRDTNKIEDNGIVKLPDGYQIGLSYVKTNNLTIGLSYSVDNWGDYKAFERKDSLANDYKITFGIQYTPDLTSVLSFWKRVTYSLGGFVGNSNISINGSQLKQSGINFGLHFPVFKSFSTVHVGMSYSNLGNTTNNLIQENLIIGYLGFSFSERWFYRPKID